MVYKKAILQPLEGRAKRGEWLTLSVSISAMLSPAATSSPSFFFQDAMFPAQKLVLLWPSHPEPTCIQSKSHNQLTARSGIRQRHCID